MEPDLIEPDKNHGQTFAATRQCWEGIVCKLCGRCNLRSHWHGWKCRTPGCAFEYNLPMDVIPASSVIGDAGYGFQGDGVTQDKVGEPSIEREIQKHGLYRECVYELDNGLTITHLISNNVINNAPGGPDDLFCQLQMEDFRLKRLPMNKQKQSSAPTREARIRKIKRAAGEDEPVAFSSSGAANEESQDLAAAASDEGDDPTDVDSDDEEVFSETQLQEQATRDDNIRALVGDEDLHCP